MVSRMLPFGEDPIHPTESIGVAFSVDAEPVRGLLGQTIAGAMLAAGTISWRTTASARRPRGLFCGIGVCFDCIATVNGERDVRLCQRRACEGDVVQSQHDALPEVAS